MHLRGGARPAARISVADRARPVFSGDKKRPLEMNAENARRCLASPPHRARCACCHLLVRIGDQRRQERGRAELAVRRNDRRDRFGRRVVVEQHVAAAIDLNVDEARSEPHAVRQRR